MILEAPVIIIVSRKDIAGMNMKRFLLEMHDFEKTEVKPEINWPSGKYIWYNCEQFSILEIPEDQIFTDYLKEGLDTKLLIFASKHTSAAGQKSLLVHTTGNWNEEQGHGGNDHEISYSPSLLLKYAYTEIKKLKETRGLDEYWAGFECTHHGPTSLDFPIIYIETGGTIEEWNNLKGCELIADVIWSSIEYFTSDEYKKSEYTALIGIGSNHYCSSFIKRIDESDLTIGHIIPKYAHAEMPISMLSEAYDKTLAPNKVFVIDKKGSRAKERQSYIEYIEKKGWQWRFSQK